MKRLFLLLSTCVDVTAAEPAVTKDSVATFYREYKRLTAEPRYVAPLTATLCAIPSKELLAKERAMVGPHARVSVHYYANPVAAEAITARVPAFPVGAVIVKEKLGQESGVTDIAGMIKRPKGYDAANGDWEFFFHSPDGKFTSGKLGNCIDCHNGGKRDHVFSVWSLPSKPERN